MAGSADSVLVQVGKILAEHQSEPGHRDLKIHCRCGWVTARTQNRGGGYHKLYRHQAAALRDAGLLVAAVDGDGS